MVKNERSKTPIKANKSSKAVRVSAKKAPAPAKVVAKATVKAPTGQSKAKKVVPASHTKVLTAEGWRRRMIKMRSEKLKKV